LLKSENQVKIMQETHLMREKELQTELNSLRASIEERTQSSKSVGDQNDQSISQEKKISDLQSELAKWEDRHQTTLESMNSSEKNLLATIAEFEAGVIAAPVASAPVEVPNKEQSRSIDKADYEQYQAEHQDLVNSLQKEIEEHKSAVIANATRVAELEESHALTRAQLDETTKSRDLTATESQGQKSLVSNLEQQIRHHEQMVKTHQDGLSLLKENHAKQLEEIASTAAADHEAQIMQLTSKHEASTQSLQAELTNARNSLTNVATQVATALGVEVSIEKLQERISSLLADQTALSVERKRGNEFENHLVELSTINDTVMKELEGVKAELSGLLAQTGEGAKLKMEHSTVSEQLAALKKEMNALETKNKKNSRLVEELEDQLATNFDEQQMATNRLSTLQTERNVQLDEANANYARVQAELAATKEEYAALQVSLFVMDVSIRC